MNGSKKHHKSEYVVSKEYPRPITNIPAKNPPDIIDDMLKEARELRAKKARRETPLFMTNDGEQN
jgi:hypothetical protein